MREERKDEVRTRNYGRVKPKLTYDVDCSGLIDVVVQLHNQAAERYLKEYNDTFSIVVDQHEQRLKRRDGMKLELGIMAGESTKKFLGDLTAIVERFEKVAGKLAKSDDNEEEVAEEAEEEEETYVEAASDDETEEEEEIVVTKKTAKAKAPTEKDVSKACHDRLERIKAKAKKQGKNDDGKLAFKKVKKFLEENFNTDSITELEVSDYAKAIKLLSGPV